MSKIERKKRKKRLISLLLVLSLAFVVSVPVVAMTLDDKIEAIGAKGTAVEVLDPEMWIKDGAIFYTSDGEGGGGSKPASTSAPAPVEYKPTYYDITYELYGGTNDTRNPDKYEFGLGVEEFFPAMKSGYDFVGWYSNADAITSDVNVDSYLVKRLPSDSSGNRRLHAKFKPKTYNITYVLFDGINDETNPVTYTYGVGVPEFKPATKPDHIFKGWFKDEALTQPVTSITDTDMEDVTLYAGFEIDTSNITVPPTEEALADNNNEGSEDDIDGASFGELFARAIKCTDNSIKYKWSEIKGAAGYLIYGNFCNLGGKKYKYKLVGETKKLEYTAKKLNKDRYYKYYIAAYKLVDGKKIIFCVSKTIHATTTSEKNGSAEKIKLNKDKVTLSVDEKFKIIAREINKTKTIKTHRPICYESSDPKVAKVDKNGKITAKKSGKCKIWVYAQNGLYVKVSVTVK